MNDHLFTLLVSVGISSVFRLWGEMVQIQKNMNLHSFNAAVTIQQMFPGISAVASVWTYDHLNYFIFI